MAGLKGVAKLAHLTEQQALAILWDYQHGVTNFDDLAKKHKTNPCVVINVTAGRSYRSYTGIIKTEKLSFTNIRNGVLAGHYNVIFHDGKYYNHKRTDIPKTIPEQIDASVKGLSEQLPLFEKPAEPATKSINIEFKVNDTVLKGEALEKVLKLM